MAEEKQLSETPKENEEQSVEKPEVPQGEQEGVNPAQQERQEQIERMKGEVERHIKEAEERLASQLGSVDAARAWARQEVWDPSSPDPREGQIYFARANLYVLNQGKRMLPALEVLGKPRPEGKVVIFAEGFTLRDVRKELSDFDEIATKKFNLPEAKGRGETKDEQSRRFNVEIQKLLTEHNAFEQFPSEGEADAKHRAYYELRSLQDELEKRLVRVDTQGMLYRRTITGDYEYVEEAIEKHRSTLTGQ